MAYEIARHDENGYTFWTVSFFDRDGRLVDRQTAATEEGAFIIVRRMCG